MAKAILLCVSQLLGVHQVHAIQIGKGNGNGLGDYKNDAYMPLQGNLADAAQTLVSLDDLATGFSESEATFNPSLTALPNVLASKIHPAALYAATLRHHNDVCSEWGIGTTKKRNGSFREASVVIMDSNLKTLALGELPYGEDHRIFVVDGTIIVTFMTYGGPHGSGYHVVKLDLVRRGNQLHAKYAEPNREGMPHWLLFPYPDRNLGVFETNLGWFDVHGFKGDGANFQADVRSLSLVAGALHNSIHPIRLQGYPDVLLGLGHTHGKLGNQYLQVFFLFKADPPFTIVKRGKPFCLKSLSSSHQQQCETVQFVGSVIQHPTDPSSLLIAYGINDCTGSIARMPLERVMADMK